jgi:filamentous hemagglutinin family protein
LFHSFGEFGVPNNNIANFLNNTGLATSNILSRVTGGNPSNIFGTIQTTGFGNASLFLMNPAGILFGPNATLNVGGSVHFTTADYLRLTDGVRFTAVPGAQDALLSSAPVAAFGFLASKPAAISVQGSALSVLPGEAISLVGGNISIEAGTLDDGTNQPAHLSAPGGQIRLASVASAGEILHPSLETAPNIEGQTFSSMGTITVSGNSTIDVSADSAGTVKIRSGRLVIDDSTISADTGEANGASFAIDINVTGDVMISNSTVPVLTARTTGTGDAGEIRITSGSTNITVASEDILTVIDTHTSGTGKAGNVSIATGDLQVSGDPIGLTFFVDSGTAGDGSGGNLTISATNVNLNNVLISTGDNGLGESPSSGHAGNVTIITDRLNLTFSRVAAESFAGESGDIVINSADIHLNTGGISATGFGRGGTVTINTNRLILDDTLIESGTLEGSGSGGGISITGNIIELRNGSQLLTSTLGDGDAGQIRVVASDHLNLSGNFHGLRPGGIFSNSFGISGVLGNAGAILIDTPSLEIADGARINTATKSNGRGGDVTINADFITISGQLPRKPTEAVFGLGNQLASGIFTSSIANTLCSGACGDAGRVSIATGSLIMNNGSQIDSGTSSSGRGGDVLINATGSISISGRLNDGTPSGIFSRTLGSASGSGQGGHISLQADQVQLSNGASISAQSSGPGNAGNITISVADSLISRNSTVNTSTTQSDGGNITITAGNMLKLDRSEITTKVQGGAGNGGNITIDPPTVLIDHSKIIASAIGGNGGNINIVAGVFLLSPDSIIDASSSFGLSGTINIDSPIQNLSGTLAPLPQGFLQVSGLLQGRCAARMQSGLSSSLVVAGRDAVPLEPGDVLPGPIFSRSTQATVSRHERPNFQMSQFNEMPIDDVLALAAPKGRC